MAGVRYLDLDLLFSESDTGYRAVVTRSPAGDGQSVSFELPVSNLELENFILRVGAFRSRTRRIESAAVIAAKQMGGRLFDAVFTGKVGESLRRSVDHARREQMPLRIRLCVSGCPGLADLPWELLYDRADDWFLALSNHTPVIRYVQMQDPPRPVQATLPLRILLIKSEPSDYPPLGLADEWEQVSQALSDLSNAKAVQVTELAAATLSELRRALLRDTFHVVHYMGHGGFDDRHGGVLVFTGHGGRGTPVTAGDLGVLFHDHVSLRLAVLNACEAGRIDPADPFAGVADTLVRRGIPAVIAMQFEVSDNAAIEFAPALYGALAASRPVDAAVAEARKAIYAVSPLEWATPVLYLRTDDAQLFAVAAKAASAGTTTTSTSQGGGSLSEAEAALREAVRLDPADGHAHGGLGNALRRLKRYPEAETELREAARLEPDAAWIHSGLGDTLFAMKRYAEAEAAQQRAIGLDSSYVWAHSGLGNILYELKRYGNAEAAYREAMRLEPDDAEIHRGLGRALNAQKRHAEAEESCKKALVLDAASAEAHCELGVALYALRRYTEAEAAHREAIRLKPTAAWPYRLLGDALCELNRHTEAETACREAVRLDPGDAWAHNSLGNVLYFLKRYSDAETEYREAVRLEPDNSVMHRNLGLALNAQER